MNKLQRLAALITATMMSFQLISIPAFAATDEVDTATDTAEEAVDDAVDEADEDTVEAEENSTDFVDVDSDDAVDELDDVLVEDGTDIEVEDDIDELVDELLEDVDTDEGAQEILEDVAVDTENVIADLEAELENTTNIAERLRLARRILRHKAFLIKLRARVLQFYPGLVSAFHKARTVDNLYSVRWGVLEGADEDRCPNMTKEEIRAALEAGEKLDCGNTKVVYDGRISVDRGEINVKKTVLFESNDDLGSESGDVIDWNSSINGHWDGLVIKYSPDEDMDGEVETTISIGELNKTFVGDEIFGKHDIGNGHMIEIRPMFRVLAGVSDKVNDRITDRKLKLQDRLDEVRERTRRIRLINKSDDVDNATEELEDVLDDIDDYNYDTQSADEVEVQINSLITDLSDGVSRANIITRLKALRVKLARIKDIAKDRKFAQKLIPFKDTDDDQWYTNFVAPMKARGIVSGYKDTAGNELGEYRPGNLVTVAELFKIGLEVAQKGGTEGEPELNSARAHWAKAYVKRAEELGLDLIQPDLDLSRYATRGEVVRMMLEALGIEAKEVFKTNFPDLSPKHKQAAYLQLAFELGIINGDDNTGNVRADDPINRAEVAKIANQVLNILVGEDIE